MLKNILIDCAQKVGLNPSDSTNRLWLVTKINEAAREIYDSADLNGCLREQIFTITEVNQQITLPYYVEKIRGVRNADTKVKIKVQDMRPRYQTGNWFQNLLSWRVRFQSPIEHDITNATQLTISIPAPETSSFTVFITGSTPTSDKITESILFNPGDLKHITTNQFTSFPGIKLIGKDNIITNNVLIQDGEGNQLAIIPNKELESKYTIIQVTDQTEPFNIGLETFEVLFKLRFTPFYDDFDEYPCGSEYDKAIFWKFLEHYYANKEDGTQLAIAANAKCQQILNLIAKDGQSGVEKEIDFGKNRYLDLIDISNFGGYIPDLYGR